ncbi:NADH dehydrogenase [ubiquinone] 1 beta subcomplex subunit 7 [Patella vulgata]|uniref:NADH dehydrogenase [ubiquinone] 1 beta subcomplex subunit 7 n=1 Tax=Patella vulgata TaxID=6465 RepID=UPI00218044CE|nr:NADH dehydrogenase [ubiquinone] 1 beta subcomplex subunit 7 [Patella vulgata]
MGNQIYAYITHPDTAPDIKSSPTFDPLYGFPNGRKERVLPLSREEMDRANMPLDKRDYCADIWLDYLTCRDKVYPLTAKCDHDYHKYYDCQYDDFVLRMKEYEREKRLKERAKRIDAKRSKEELE